MNYQQRKIKGSAMIEYGLLAAAATIMFAYLPDIATNLETLFTTAQSEITDFNTDSGLGMTLS